MLIEDILLEYDRTRAMQALGKGLWLARVRDLTRRTNINAIPKDVLDSYTDTIEKQQILANHTMQVIEDADPTTNKKYTQWMARQYINGSEPKLEDIESTMATIISKFNTLSLKRKLAPGDTDINKFKTARQLYSAMDKYDDPDFEADTRKILADKVYEDNTVTVIIPRNVAAACAYGRQTRWCTAATKGNNYFDSYNDAGPLFILIPKAPVFPNEKYQLHFESSSYMDQDDDSVSLTELLTDRFSDGLKNFFIKHPDSAMVIRELLAFIPDGPISDVCHQILEIITPDINNALDGKVGTGGTRGIDTKYYEFLAKWIENQEDNEPPSYDDFNPSIRAWATKIKDVCNLSPDEIRHIAEIHSRDLEDSVDGVSIRQLGDLLALEITRATSKMQFRQQTTYICNVLENLITISGAASKFEARLRK
jgi:hypothetical protein